MEKIFQQFIRDITFNVRLIGKKAFSINNLKHIADYTQTNKHGADIYFRPENNSYVMLDLDSVTLSQGTLKALKKDKAFLIVQTSKHCYQVWFYCSLCKSDEDYITYAKYFATKYSGDLKSTKPKQVGRLVGYINHKKDRNNFKTKLIWKSLKTPVFSKKLKGNPLTEIEKTPKIKTTTISGGNVESQFEDMKDWAFISMVYERNPEKTYQDLYNILCSQSPHGYNSSYISHTINNLINKKKD